MPLRRRELDATEWFKPLSDRLSEISRSRRVLGMLFLDGFYRQGGQGLKFVPVPAPSPAELQRLVQTIAERIGRSLERAGLITRDIDNAYLAFDPCEEAPINTLLGHSITYRIAAGPREGQKVFTLQTLPPDAPRSSADVAEASGFSLHAGVSAKGADRETLEHLARYIARPPIASERLALTERGHIRYTLKTPYRDGTTHVIFEPFDFIARLAVLVPKPRAHLTRFHGVFAPHSALRAQVVPKRKTGTPRAPSRTEVERHQSMTWAKRLKRVFAIEIERCWRCGGKLRVIASIEDEALIERILDHLGSRAKRSTSATRAGRRRAASCRCSPCSHRGDRAGQARLTGGSGHTLCPTNDRSVFLRERRRFSGRHRESIAALQPWRPTRPTSRSSPYTDTRLNGAFEMPILT